jgi:hypothetical protein
VMWMILQQNRLGETALQSLFFIKAACSHTIRTTWRYYSTTLQMEARYLHFITKKLSTSTHCYGCCNHKQAFFNCYRNEATENVIEGHHSMLNNLLRSVRIMDLAKKEAHIRATRERIVGLEERHEALQMEQQELFIRLACR